MPQTYTIQSGDTLSQIAQSFNTTVEALQASNPDITDPNLIQIGGTLNIAEQQAEIAEGDVEQMPSEIDVSTGEEPIPELLQEGSYSNMIQQTTQGALSAVQQMLLNVRTEQAEAAAASIKAEKTAKEAAELGLKDFREAESELELYKKFEEETGLKAREQELENIFNQAKSLQEQYITDADALIGASATMKTLTGKRQQLARTLDAKVSLLTASADIVNLRIDSAESRINNYFTRALNDRNAEIERREKLIELHDKNIFRLDQEQKIANEDELKILSDFNTRQENDKKDILSLLLAYPQELKNAAGDIDLENDSYEDIVKTLSPYIAAEEQRKFNILHGGSIPGMTTEGFSSSKVEANFREDLNKYLEIYRTADFGNPKAGVSDFLFIKWVTPHMRTLYNKDMVDDGAWNTMFGITPYAEEDYMSSQQMSSDPLVGGMSTYSYAQDEKLEIGRNLTL